MPRQKTIEHVDENARTSRVPLFDQPRNVLTVSGADKSFVQRWFNDVDERIHKAKLGGWEVVTYGDLKAVGDRTVDTQRHSDKEPVTKAVGGGTIAYLMQIKREWYEQDQAAKQARVDELEQSMLPEDKDDQHSRTYGRINISR